MTTPRRPTRWIAAAFAAISLAVAAPTGAQTPPSPPQLPGGAGPGDPGAIGSQGVLREQHGDWRILCEAAAGPGAERCMLWQYIESQERSGFAVIVTVLKHVENKTHMRVAVPLGVFLPRGLSLRIDGEEAAQAPFLYCYPYACLTEAVVPDDLLAKLNAGSEMLVVLFERPDKGTGFVVSLNGFAAAHEALDVWRVPLDAASEAPAPPAPAPGN